MDRDEIASKVVAAIARGKGVPEEEVGSDVTFEELGVDSLEAIEILFMLEEEFDFDIPDDMAKEIDSVPEAIDRLTRELAARVGKPESGSQDA